MNSPRPTRPDAFLELSKQSFARVPPDEPEASKASNRPLLLGLAAAIGDYVLGSLVLGTKSGSAQATSALLALAAGMFIGNIRNLRSLCATDPEKKAQDRHNVVKGSVGGALAGAGLIKLIPVAAATAMVDGGVTLAGLLVAGTGTLLYNRLKKKKYCPHCRKKGHCSQSVCRFCHRLFYPDDKKIDCADTPYLSWDRVAAHLDRCKLSYFDAELLVRDQIGEWKVYDDPDQLGSLLDCQSFLDWTNRHKELVVSYRGRGTKGKTEMELSKYLSERSL